MYWPYNVHLRTLETEYVCHILMFKLINYMIMIVGRGWSCDDDDVSRYAQLLHDCHACYFQQRLALLGRSVTSAVADLAAKHSRDHCALVSYVCGYMLEILWLYDFVSWIVGNVCLQVRSGCAFIVHVCEDECQLFYNFFSKYTPQLE